MLSYAVIAFLQVRRIGRDREEERRTNSLLILLLFLVHSFGMLTIFVSMKDMRYLYFWLFQAIVFAFYLVLYRNLYPQANQTLCIHICMMLSLGLIIITRLSFSKAVKQFVIAAVGMILTIAVPAFMKKFRFLKKLTYIYAGIGIVMLGVVLVFGQATQGSNITWTVAGVTLQPSEFVKIIFVFYLASAYYESSTPRDVLRAGIISAIHVLILVASKDLGSALIFFIAYIFMTYIATQKWHYLLLGAGLGGVGAVLAYKIFRHVQVRVTAWLDPWSVIDSMGFQITQSLFSICSGGPFGVGLTKGTPDKIPYVESDFIFSAITEEMGMIVAISLLVMCLVIFFHILWISLNFSDRFYRFSAFGFAVMYIFQTFLTVGGDTKFIPLTGVTLPLVSYGGSSVLSTIFMFSVIESIYIMQQDRIRAFQARFERENRERPVPDDSGDPAARDRRMRAEQMRRQSLSGAEDRDRIAASGRQAKLDRKAALDRQARQDRQARKAALDRQARQDRQTRKTALDRQAKQDRQDRKAALDRQAKQDRKARQAALDRQARQERQAGQECQAGRTAPDRRDRQSAPVRQTRQYPQARQYPQERQYPRDRQYPQERPYPGGSRTVQERRGGYAYQESAPLQENDYFDDTSTLPLMDEYSPEPQQNAYAAERPLQDDGFYYDETSAMPDTGLGEQDRAAGGNWEPSLDNIDLKDYKEVSYGENGKKRY
ncbi:MAG: FtsW/RodA/SpoVE family cell cycle protein [Lachnospiraceae bacterium]|jgi:cell division protein FtsW (lipid II flippase)|nr:FtsW/RodA/SpoVE family cell cycle protein [Lachnospiraceae bacterium]